MRSIAVLNQKGGTGKTTTTVNLAAALGETGQHVLVVDMDPQGGTTRWFGIGDPGRGIADIFVNNRPLVTLVRPTDVRGVSVVPASAWLNGAEKALAWEPGAVRIFRHSLDSLPPGQWEFLLVDCPPALNLLIANALMGVHEVLLPMEAHHIALPGVNRAISAVETLRDYLHPRLSVVGILPCRVDARARQSREVVQELRSRFGELVFDVEIRENVRLAEAPAHFQPITTYDSSSPGAQDYRALAAEILAGNSFINA